MASHGTIQPTMVTKQALDQKAKDYWSEYFGDYGELWVREIPRRIKAALDDPKHRTADASDGDKLADGKVVPWGHSMTADRVVLDGVFCGQTESGKRVAKLFRAAFTHDGELTDLRVRPAPAV